LVVCFWWWVGLVVCVGGGGGVGGVGERGGRGGGGGGGRGEGGELENDAMCGMWMCACLYR